MREIKFRGLRTDGKGWVYGVPYYVAGERKCFVIDNCQSGNLTQEDSIFQGKEVEYKSVGQFTGLKDKNGKDIYEGDRLRHLRKYNNGHISVCSVVFRNGGFFLYYGNFIYEHSELINRTDYTFEIIGNIHEQK